MAVQPDQTQLRHGQNPAHHLLKLAIITTEAKLGPHRLTARTQVNSKRYGQGVGTAFGDFTQIQQLIDVIDLDHRPLSNCALHIGLFLMGAIENNVVPFDPVVPGLFVFKAGHHLSYGTLLMKHATDRVEVIRLVTPSKLNVWITPRKGAVCNAIGVAQGGLGKHKKGAAMFPGEFRNADSVDVRTGGRCTQPERIDRPLIESLQSGADIG